ncbi:MAG: YvcK family protein [Chloroflexi bacterium]|nr:YvcK family protein [Chloroflexota bacterium]
MDSLRLLYPGVRIKRWLALGGVGIFVFSFGISYLLIRWADDVPDTILDTFVGAVFLLVLGVVIGVLALWRLYKSLAPFLAARGGGSLANRIYRERLLEHGPKVVALGGGTGLSTLLRGLKEHTANITAILTVADDGGSSGRLRRELGVLPPGDFRNCLVALADAEPLVTQLFEYRFGEGSGLAGHSFGNLFIVAMSGVTGDFEKAIHASSRVLAVRGQIMPSTLENVTLYARMENEAVVYGESNITQSGNHVRQVYIQPESVEAYPEAVKAILAADLIVIGPGSLYTSLLPNLLVKGVCEAIRQSRAPKVYVCNVATQPGETDGYTLADHINALRHQVGDGLFEYVVANSNVNAVLPEEWGNKVVALDVERIQGMEVILDDVVNEEYRLRHDPKKLAALLMDVYYTSKGRNSRTSRVH